jgi:hypothetical protein
MRAVVTVSQGSRMRGMEEPFTAWEAWRRRKEILLHIFLSVREQRLHMIVQMYFLEWLSVLRNRVYGEGRLCAMKLKSMQRLRRSAVAQWGWWVWTARGLRKLHQIVADRHVCMHMKGCFVGWACWVSTWRTNRAAVTQLRQKWYARLMGDVYCEWLEQVKMQKVERVASLLQCEDHIRPLLLPLVAKCLEKSSTKAFGLMWSVVGDVRPNGQKLINSRLAAALKGKTNFTEDEWLNFGIQGLRADHYIKSGGTFYQPLDIEVLHLDRAAHISKMFDNDISVNAAANLLGDGHVICVVPDPPFIALLGLLH